MCSQLRTVPPFVTAHAFRPYRNGLRNSDFLRTVLVSTKVFLRGYDYARKADLGKGCWNPKRKLAKMPTTFLELLNYL